jgi:hypothetical protein
MMIRTVVYLPYRLQAAYVALGWVCSPLRGPHGWYSLLAEWPFDGAPVYPEKSGAAA